MTNKTSIALLIISGTLMIGSLILSLCEKMVIATLLLVLGLMLLIAIKCYDWGYVTAKEELVDKETPMKPIAYKLPYEVHDGEVVTKYYDYKCPKCNGFTRMNKYCPHCGQRLDWSGKDDS